MRRGCYLGIGLARVGFYTSPRVSRRIVSPVIPHRAVFPARHCGQSRANRMPAMQCHAFIRQGVDLLSEPFLPGFQASPLGGESVVARLSC
jgi:hypothetical protein